MRMDFIVPLAVKFVPLDTDFLQLLGRYLAPVLVFFLVQPRVHFQPLLRLRRPDQVNYYF